MANKSDVIAIDPSHSSSYHHSHHARSTDRCLSLSRIDLWPWLSVQAGRSKFSLARGRVIPKLLLVFRSYGNVLWWRCTAMVCRTAYRIAMHSFDRFPTGGKCAVCGEPFDKPVKLFEKGGSMYKGTVLKTYNQGEQIEVKVMVSRSRT